MLKEHKKKAAVSGVAQTPVTRDLKGTIKDVANAVITEALADAGVTKEAVDGFYVSPAGLSGPPALLYACDLANYLQLTTKNLCMFECGGASAAMAFRFARDQILLGRNHCAVVFAVDYRTFDVPKDNFEIFFHDAVFYQTSLYGAFEGQYGIGTPIPYYAMSGQRYMHEFNIADEDIAEVCVTLRNHAVKNENALFKKPLTVSDVLASPVISPPLHVLECCFMASAAAAVVLTSSEVSKTLKQTPVHVTAVGEHHHPSHFIPVREGLTAYPAVAAAAKDAYAQAEITAQDVDAAEIQGVFAPTELMVYEDLGFFEKGKATQAVKEGKTTFTGKPCINPSGGRLSQGYPAGTAPLLEVVEIVQQLRGNCGGRQVKNARIGLMHAEHGMMNGSVVAIFERE